MLIIFFKRALVANVTFFFFQAEDGIRDRNVTGVQTCALPICDLARQIPAGPWLDWAAQLVPAVTIEAVIAWLDAGQPDPGQAAGRIAQAVHGVIQAAQPALTSQTTG